MKTKHYFVPALDINELLPFMIMRKKVLAEQFAEEERAKEELTRFIDSLERRFKQSIQYVGMDVIGEKNYVRFLFAKVGFLEILTERPVAINAHFPDKKMAASFKKALVETLRAMIKDPSVEMFLDSIEVQDQDDTSLTVQKWRMMTKIRKS